MAARVPWGEGGKRRASRSARLRKKACRLELLLFRSARLAGSFDRENPGKRCSNRTREPANLFHGTANLRADREWQNRLSNSRAPPQLHKPFHIAQVTGDRVLAAARSSYPAHGP